MTNLQAQAYARLAMEVVGVEAKTIEKVLLEMDGLFDELTEKEAEKRAFHR